MVCRRQAVEEMRDGLCVQQRLESSAGKRLGKSQKPLNLDSKVEDEPNFPYHFGSDNLAHLSKPANGVVFIGRDPNPDTAQIVGVRGGRSVFKNEIFQF